MPKMKSYATFDDYLAAQSLENRSIIRELRRIVNRTAPELVESVKWGNGCWLKGKVPVAYVHAEQALVQFGFLLGSRLEDPCRLLEGSGRYVRYVNIFDAAETFESELVSLLRQAIAATPERMSDLFKVTPTRKKAGRKVARKAGGRPLKPR
jgi:hypothetical protein